MCLYLKINKHILNYILHRADLILPISETMIEDLVKDGNPKSKMQLFPMGVNLKLFSKEKKGTQIRDRYNFHNNRVILYAGSLDYHRDLAEIIKAFYIVRQSQEKIKFLIVGDGNDRQNLERLVVDLEIQNDVIFTKQVPYNDMPDYIAVADICLSPIPPIPVYKLSSPTKMFEYMAMAKPIIANHEIPDQKKAIEESHCGILVNYEAESFAQGILQMLTVPDDKFLEIGRRGYDWVEKHRSYEKIAYSIEERYWGLICRNEQ